MSTDEREYVIAPWREGECETSVVAVDLPSRELVAHLEVPTTVLDDMVHLAEEHDISPAQALAERLEMNRARVSLLAAKSVEETAQVHEHLTDACRFITGVEALDASDLEAEIRRVWDGELGPV